MYKDREEAAQVLARHLKDRFAETEEGLVLAIPRGGVPFGYRFASSGSVRRKPDAATGGSRDEEASFSI